VIQTTIARRYAKALFDLQDQTGIEPTAETLRLLAEAFADSKEFRALLVSPIFTRDQKTAVVSQLAARAGCPPVTERFLTYVVRKNRITQIREMSDAFTKLVSGARNRTAVAVSSARPLADRELATIRARLERVTRSTIDLAVHVDPQVIGGLEIRIGSTVYDGTIRGRLGRLRAKLANL